MTSDRHDAAKTLQEEYAGLRLSFGRFGTSKTLSKTQKQEAADPFGADGDFIRAGKKILDTTAPEYKAVTSVINKAREYWTANTLPYVEAGTRLCRQDRLEKIIQRFAGFRAELEASVDALDSRYEELREQARAKLGDLYADSDYPMTLRGLFRIEWDMPSLAPPEYLRSVNPALYEEQSQRIAARFDAAVGMAEEAFATELAACVEKLRGKLAGLDDGSEKVLHASTVENLREFFNRFRSLNLHSSAELDAVAAQAETVLSGQNLFGAKPIGATDLRNSEALRRDVATRLSAVSAALEGMVTAAPRRNIVRRKPAADAAPANSK